MWTVEMPYLVIWQVVHVASGKTWGRIYQRDLRGMLSLRWCQAPCLLCRSSTRQRQRQRHKMRQCQTKAKKKTSLSGRWCFAYHQQDKNTDKIRMIVFGWSTRLVKELTCIVARVRRVGVFDFGTGRVGYLQKSSGIGEGTEKNNI